MQMKNGLFHLNIKSKEKKLGEIFNKFWILEA